MILFRSSAKLGLRKSKIKLNLVQLITEKLFYYFLSDSIETLPDFSFQKMFPIFIFKCNLRNIRLAFIFSFCLTTTY